MIIVLINGAITSKANIGSEFIFVMAKIPLLVTLLFFTYYRTKRIYKRPMGFLIIMYSMIHITFFGATGFDVSDDYLQQMLFIKENKPLLYWGILLGPFFAISAIIGNVIIIITPAREKKHTDEELDRRKSLKKRMDLKLLI